MSETPDPAPVEPDAPAPVEEPSVPQPEVAAEEKSLLAAPPAAESGEPEPAPIDPESYELKFPSDFTVDDAAAKVARETFAKANVPKDAAQPLLDLYIDLQRDQAKAAQDAFTTEQNKWKTEIDALPGFTDGETKSTSLAAIGRVFDEYGPEAREAFNDPRVGNNPKVIAFMHKIASALSEGSPTSQGRPIPQGRANGRSRDPAALYPNTPQVQGN